MALYIYCTLHSYTSYGIVNACFEELKNAVNVANHIRLCMCQSAII